jgi:Family of unknown function (DUF6600)
MKITKWFAMVAAVAVTVSCGYAQTPEAAPGQAPAAVPSTLSPAAAEVVRLATSGVGDDVTLAYIQNSQAPFSLSANDILYLKDVGLSPQVTSAMISHDGALRGQQYAPAPAAPAPAPVVPPPSAVQPAPAPAPTVAATPAPVYVSSPPADVSYFYSDLAPYGTWVQLDGVGWCWQPTAVVVTHGWRPYCDGGSWVYSDLGWYWQSTYSWGWAPFHYGRWHLHPRCGWVWMPDRTWGPAWVTWRTAGDTCGWAPLPPHSEFDVRLGWRFNGVTVGANFGFGLGSDAFLFIGLGDFCSHDLRSRCLPPARVATVYRQATIVNNYTVVNNTVVHRGIPVERVSAVSHVAVPRATVRDWAAAPGKTPARAGSVVYRPRLETPARPVSMQAQRIDTQHPVIQHAPAVPARVEPRTATAQRYQAPPGTRTSAAPASRTSQSSAWSPSVQSAPSQQSKLAATAPQTAPVAASRYARATRPPDDWKQGSRSAPGYRSDTGLPAQNNSRSAEQATPAASSPSNPHVYYPKGYYQAAEIHSLPPLDNTPSTSSSPRGNRSDTRGQKDR